MTRSLNTFALAVAVLGACGDAPPIDPPPLLSLFPLVVGNRWQFAVSGGQTKVQTVTGTTTLEGRKAFVLTTDGSAGNKTVSVQYFDDEGRLLRASERTYNTDGTPDENERYVPGSLRLHTRMRTLGATYPTMHEEQHLDASDNLINSTVKQQTFTVEAVDESISVPAGTFRCVRVRRDTVGGSSKTYWFAEGVGKIREVGGQTENLYSADVRTEELP